MIDPNKIIRKRKVKQQKHIIDRCYVKADKTKKIVVNKNGYVSVCLSYLYLDSWISYNLNDEYDINLKFLDSSLKSITQDIRIIKHPKDLPTGNEYKNHFQNTIEELD